MGDHPPETWAYLAGLIDGEGCLKRTKAGTASVRLAMNMTHRETMEWVHARFSGSLYSKEMPDPTHQLQWAWEVNALNDLRWILKHTLPFMVTKRQQAERVLEFLTIVKWNPPSAPIRREAWEGLADLNKPLPHG